MILCYFIPPQIWNDFFFFIQYQQICISMLNFQIQQCGVQLHEENRQLWMIQKHYIVMCVLTQNPHVTLGHSWGTL